MALTTAPQNELLVQIVELLGGTVRDPKKRNWLLEDWSAAIGASTILTDGTNTLVNGVNKLIVSRSM